ncbi:26S proteasome regulatory subunit RPN2 [Mycena sanguinolenta]|uniref:26S proteasome regulatory subunit RPN2 n=1 Tax=Mycena sanguinolenta TaxID=230812 RepID=A0A8H6XI59_9AGAR|nr:26S proteasome regulatory subunit RPN2 [Mycena sanguinolenta]
MDYFEQGKTTLGPYLPRTGGESNVPDAAYSEGGSLYALGLINAGWRICGRVKSYSIGLGVAAMGSKGADAFGDLKNTLSMDSAVVSEACGYATVVAYPQEKIICGLTIRVAFIYYGWQEADKTIKLLLAEKDPNLCYGGVYTLILVYTGTSKNDAVRPSDDLLSESYNLHARCGATLALGIACAGTGLQDAVEILEPMTEDSVDFVRQGVFIALGMILVQQSEVSSPSLVSTRALYHKVVSYKHKDPIARFGAALGQGFIDAGGRNLKISLRGRAGGRNTNAIVGMYPLAHCACLSSDPTGIIELNADLKAPKFEHVSNARPSLFAYPASTKPPKKEAVSKVAAAVLSTTGKDDKVDEKKESDGDMEMKVDEEPGKGAGDISPINGLISNLAEDGKPAAKATKRPSPPQLAYITFPPEGRFRPVRAVPAKPAPLRKAGAAGSKVLSPPPIRLVSEEYAGGSCLLIWSDLRPGEEVEFIYFACTRRVRTCSAWQQCTLPYIRRFESGGTASGCVRVPVQWRFNK